MILPNPAVAEVAVPSVDEVTDTTDYDGPPLVLYLIEPVVSGLMVSYADGPDRVVRGFEAPGLIESGRFFSTPDGLIKIRAIDPYDAVHLAPSPGIPQPIDVIRAEILRGGALATELDAVVAADNTVVTLMLETGTGTYVRYGSDWQRLGEDSNSLEDHALVPVGAAAVDIFDAADAANTTISVGDLPVPVTRNGEDVILDPMASVEPLAASAGVDAITAAGVLIPEITDEADLPLAVRFASAHPTARWYVVKMAKALGALDKVPTDWQGATVIPFEPAV